MHDFPRLCSVPASDPKCRRFLAVSLSSLASLYGSAPQKDLVHGCAWFKPLSSLPSPDLDTCMIVRAWSKNPGLRSRGSCPALASISQPSKLYLFTPETAQLSRKPSPHPQPSLVSLTSECPQHRELVPQDFICWTSIYREGIVCRDGYH